MSDRAGEHRLAPAEIASAAEALAAGELVAFPTETVYGLGARADDDRAVAAIYAAKGRPSDHPLIVHVLDADAAAPYAAILPEAAQRLMAAFWPGPLTVVLPRAPGVATAAAGGQPGIALRAPAHPVARALLSAAAALGVHGVAAPSANRYGRISPTRADHVRHEFGATLRLLDGGDCTVGIESAIVDCTRGAPVLLRPGVLWPSAIEAAAGVPLRGRDGQAPRAPGDRASHYAPDAALRLATASALDAAVATHLQQHSAATIAVYSRARPAPHDARVLHRTMPDEPLQAAMGLYGALRDFDRAGVGTIWAELPPGGQAWDGVRDRLQRAAAER